MSGLFVDATDGHLDEQVYVILANLVDLNLNDIFMYKMRITANGKIKNINVAACNSGLVTCWISIGNPQYADSSK